jgi:hypothetical protein
MSKPCPACIITTEQLLLLLPSVHLLAVHFLRLDQTSLNNNIREKKELRDDQEIIPSRDASFSRAFTINILMATVKINMKMRRLSRSLSRFETQDIKTQPRLNHYKRSGYVTTGNDQRIRMRNWKRKS